MRKGKKLMIALMALLSAGMLFTAVSCGGGGDNSSSSAAPGSDSSTGSTSSDTGGEDSGGENSSSSSGTDAEHLDSVPQSTLKTRADADGSIAEANWFAEYGETAMEFTVYVEDSAIYTGGSIYDNDGVEIILSKVQHVKGYSEKTISVSVDAAGNIKVKNLFTSVDVEDSGITASATEFTLTDETTDGYYINVSVPYSATEITKAEMDAAVCFGLTNADSAASLKSVYDSTYGTIYENVHTYIAITSDNTFTKNPYVNYSLVWGDANENLKASSAWNTDGDDGSDSANIFMTKTDGDSYIYMRESNADPFYAEVKINVTGLFNDEKWGKFGLTVTSADGTKGFFYYVAAAAADGKNFNQEAVGLGFNGRSGKGSGSWKNEWKSIGSLGGTSAQYTGENYVTLGIYRQGSAYKLYANGEFISMISSDIGEDEEAYVGLASFNITMKVKDYSLETDPNNLGDYEIVVEEKDYLFVGDSYIDTAFWYTYDNVFGDLSAANEGVGGTKTEYWLGMVNSLKQRYDPANIVMHIGVNDIDDGNTTGEVTIERLNTLMEAYQTAFPEADIYYVGLVHNMMFKNKWAEYDKVNAHMKKLAEEDAQINFINMAQYITADESGSTMSWFNADGLHYGVDGYAVFNRELCKALGIERVSSKNGLGDVTAEGAPAFSYSGGWEFDAEGVAHNTGRDESQIFLSNLYAADFYAEVKISVNGLNKQDDYPKAGIAVRTSTATYFFGLDARKLDNTNSYNNNWSNVFYRPETINRAWSEYYKDYQFVYDASYDYNNNTSFKTLGVVKVGTALYFLADGKVVNCILDAYKADEKAAVSVFNFNMDMYAKDPTVITDAAKLKEKLDSLKIYENSGKKIDGDISDWTEAQKSNPYEIPVADGRSVTIYATMDTDGIYVFYDVVHNSYVTDKGNWFDNTNFEIKFKDNIQRYASASGHNSRWDVATRQINAAKFVSKQEDGKWHTTAEAFIAYSCIDGVDVKDAYTMMGFAWKTGGEKGFAWADGDYWYGPEADPGLRNVIVTANGIKTGTERKIDGDLVDWAEDTFIPAKTAEGVTANYSAFLGTDGLYLALKIEASKIIVDRTNTGELWHRNTNLEFFGTDNTNAARIITFGGKVYHTGQVTDAAINYTDGEEKDTLVFEIFIANENMKNITSETKSVKLDFGGQLYTDAAQEANWQDYLRGADISKKAQA